MKKEEFNNLFRTYARESLSPTSDERIFITDLYEDICIALNNNCIQIGSYPRFTSITPLHDLDVLYILGDMSSFIDTPTTTLQSLKNHLQSYFHKQTKYKLQISLQTHSVTISFLGQKNEEYFAIDVVPAYINGKNEFEQHTYVVPEIVNTGRSKRPDFYKNKTTEKSAIRWIKSDPRGYIKTASNIDKRNNDYRKSVKFVKKWKQNISKVNESFKLKSFHIEQLFVRIFQNNPDIDIFSAIFEFFTDLPECIKYSQITDRADPNVYIDSYIDKLTHDEKKIIIAARDGFLIKLEDFNEKDSIEILLDPYFYERKSPLEQYLFDEKIPTFTDESVCINGWIQKDNHDSRLLNNYGIIDNGYKIRFEKFMSPPCDLFKWKVKNDNASPQPRGEITDNQTKNYIEETVFPGKHYVECYAIKNNICIAKARQNVIINR